MGVLKVQRLIETERVAQLSRGAGCGAFTEHLLDWIAGDNVNHQKDEGEHQPEGRQSQQKALENVTKHRKENYDRETTELVVFPGRVSESLVVDGTDLTRQL